MHALGPTIPIVIRKSSVIRETAIGPFCALRTEEMAEGTFCSRIVKSLRRSARDPHVCSEVVLIYSQGPIGKIWLGKGDIGSIPNHRRRRRVQPQRREDEGTKD